MPGMKIGGTNMPQVNRGGQIPGQKRLYHSRPEQALIIDKTLAPGYGLLPAGTILAKNLSAAGNKGLLVPYTPDAIGKTDLGRAFLVASYVSGETVVYVTMADSYKFAVGDDLILCANISSTLTYHNGGAISAIDRTTNPHMAKITFTTALVNANFTIANSVNAYVEAGTTGKLNKAVYVLDQDVNTGKFVDDPYKVPEPKGALASVVISNAVLYKNSLVGYDTQAATDLSATVDGQFFILK
jgi:hypothetical protein